MPCRGASTTRYPAWLEESAGESLQLASLLGVRTAELHTVLAQADTPALRPEPTTPEDLRGFAARVRREAEATVQQLEAQGRALDRTALERGLERLGQLAETTPDWQKVRVHGDYHLGQIIRAEGELYILDFEGEPARPLSERRERDQALRDVAGMLRSLEYVGLVAWQQYVAESGTDDETWADLLIRWSEAAFLEAYLSTAGDAASFLPQDAETRELVIWAYQLDKVLYEVRYELGSRPDWVWLPLRGLERLLS
jgi:maltose alpha-D-glucosyltransferase/alpha-amylase